MEYTMSIAGHERHLPLCAINENLYIAAFVIFGDSELTESAAAQLLKEAPEFDVIVTAESKGIPLAHEMSRQAGYADYVVLRKAPKLYMREVISTTVDSITTDHVQTLCLGRDDVIKLKDRRVLVVDDVISTGESLLSMEAILAQIYAQIVGRMAILAEGDAAMRNDIVFLEKLPLFNSEGNPL